jgi:predicted dehydrogenase
MIRVAFVGCGGMAAHYLPVYQKLDWVELVHCVDPAIGVSDFGLALAPDIDAIIINTPNHLHRPQAVAAIEAGKHVLLQKPVAPTLADAEAIQAAAEKSTRTVGLYMSYFDQPLIHDLRDLAAGGRLGNIVHCYARLMHKGGMMWSDEALAGKPTWRGSLAETGGGCFIQLAVHYLHIFEWVTGARIHKATGFTRNLHCPGLEGEDLAVGIFEFDSGAIATIDTAWCTNGEELAIHGTEGRCLYRENRLAIASTRGPFEGRVVRYSGGLLPAFGGPQGEEQTMEINPPAFADTENPLNQHRQFLEAVRDGRRAPVSIASGVRDMRVVAALYQSTRQGRAVEVG